MTLPPTAQSLRDHPAVRRYQLGCLACLLLVLVVLFAQGHGPWSFFPVLVGALGVVQRWRSAPLLFLATLAGFLAVQTVSLRAVARLDPLPGFRLSDWVLSAATLGYVMAHYRLQGLLVYLFPPDRRRREGPARRWLFLLRKARVIRVCRSPDLVSDRELSGFVLALPLWATMAQVCWLLLPPSWSGLRLPGRAERALLLAWCVALVLVVTAALLDHLGWRRLTRTEAALFLQDTAWRETCREQRRIERWRVWARWRRRKEKV